ncbi:helix-turn-helix domain-containing protein [Heyndrickxia acidiproducens]|uniref:helix-turn-helix domain-containing protein n=1 Tax=Heyndrickxia acidiproducens TaxID=1121084 RepID=UPI00036321FA|nr:helix-turn-helix domain-containing protein [Heyndrickxia acidiproducens]
MSFLQAVVLDCFDKLNGERTPFSIYHLLKGKKSAQTIQDAHLFHVENIFQTYQAFTRDNYEQFVNLLLSSGYLRQTTGGAYIATGKGRTFARGYKLAQNFPYLNGLKYQETAAIFWKRLSLITQVASHFVYQNRFYYPVQRDPRLQAWVKSWLRQFGRERGMLAEMLYADLYRLFSNHPAEQPEILVLRLTGANRIGKTIGQAASLLQIETTEYWYRFLHLLHFMVQYMMKHPGECPLLYTMVKDVYQEIPLTRSAFRTYEMLKKGKTVSEIAAARQLKQSTIEDHLVEAALNDAHFPLNDYVSKEIEEKILKAAGKLKTRKLKPIKESIGDISYFQIRLVMAGRMVRHETS